MEFDNFIRASCAAGNSDGGDVDPLTCQVRSEDGDDSPEPPAVDDRCADPAFYAANPTICAGYPILLLKPEYATVQQGATLQFKTYLRASGNEQLLSAGLAYSSASPTVAVIAGATGLASGVTVGITTISVTWQNLRAFAQMEVVATCDAISNNFLILIDNSLSAGVAFSDSYASRLSYAKTAAVEFAELVNYGKDKVAIGSFNSSGSITLSASVLESSIIAAIQAITGTSSKTNLHVALQTGMDYLNTLTGRKVIVLLTDGENNEGADPLLLSEPWKDGGNLIVVVGLRSWGSFFDKLYRIASTGYFLSAYEATEDSVIETLAALKNYICSGDCQPTAGTYPKAALNYTGFVNWDVIEGAVDLIGLGTYDVLPGNGLYVDMAGTLAATPFPSPTPGKIRSKVAYPFVSGEEYQFQISVAGNNVGQLTHIEPVHVLIQSEDGLTDYLDETITPASAVQPFVVSTFTFTAAATKNAKILIEMVPVSGEGTTGLQDVGPLIDVISLENLDTSTVLLTDDFDEENEVTIEPGQQYYGGCMTSPPGAQSADPTPPTPPIEN